MRGFWGTTALDIIMIIVGIITGIFWLINAGNWSEIGENEKKVGIILLTLTIAFGTSLGLTEGIYRLGYILVAILGFAWIIIMVFAITSVFIDNINMEKRKYKDEKEGRQQEDKKG